MTGRPEQFMEARYDRDGKVVAVPVDQPRAWTDSQAKIFGMGIVMGALITGCVAIMALIWRLP